MSATLLTAHAMSACQAHTPWRIIARAAETDNFMSPERLSLLAGECI